MNVQFKLDGDQQLIRNLQQLNRTASGRALRQAAKKGAESIVESAKRKVAVDTGRTKRYIRSWFKERKSHQATVATGVTAPTRKDVAKFLEEGTSRTPAQPFLRPAIDENQQKAADDTQAEMARGILEEVQKLEY